MNSLAKKVNQRIDHLLNYPGCDKKTLSRRKTMWLANLMGLGYISFVIPVKLIFQPQALVTIYYCYILEITLFLIVVISPGLKKYFNLYYIVNSMFEILLTFIVIALQGGISTSYSYLIVTLAFVFLTIPLNNFRLTTGFFFVYAVLTVTVAVIGSSMKVSADLLLKPEWNEMVSIVNVLSMSAIALYFISTFMKKQQELEQREAAKQKELNEAKTRLFTNMTHEFRTPLTVIRGMADLAEHQPDLWIPEATHKIKNNSNMLLRLVTQMLDISKIEAKAMPVHAIKGDLALFTTYLVELQRSAAIEKNINLNFSSPVDPMILDFDPDKISQILTNLIGNALKFTAENGSINVKINQDETGKFYSIIVTDTGKGIPDDKIQFVFDRFYQVESHANSGGGSGLGLSLVKDLTELMDGTISVESKLDKGSVFTVTLPVTQNAAADEKLLANFQQKIPAPAYVELENYGVSNKEHEPKQHLPLLMIVEDNKDVSRYVSAILQHEYQVEFAKNGKIGFEKAIEKIPDIVLSDIMMPEMDGIEMLEKLKTDFRTSHIPVVLLTAKADIESRLEGLERGADAYLTKPFNESELHIQLKNLIELRKKLHQRYASLEKLPESNEPELKTEDTFVRKVRDLLEKNLDNDEFSINDVCREMAVGHTQLYRKFKSISNLTIADYFKMLRLNRAKDLLSDPEMNITQVAFAVGFKNLSHFSREFTLQYGKSPKEIRKMVENKVIVN